MLKFGTVSIIETSNSLIGGKAKLLDRCTLFEQKNIFAEPAGKVIIVSRKGGGFRLTQCYEA